MSDTAAKLQEKRAEIVTLETHRADLADRLHTVTVNREQSEQDINRLLADRELGRRVTEVKLTRARATAQKASDREQGIHGALREIERRLAETRSEEADLAAAEIGQRYLCLVTQARNLVKEYAAHMAAANALCPQVHQITEALRDIQKERVLLTGDGFDLPFTLDDVTEGVPEFHKDPWKKLGDHWGPLQIDWRHISK